MVWKGGLSMDEREHLILEEITKGATNRKIAGLLELSEGRTRQVVSRMYRRLGVRDRVQAAAWYVRRYG